MFGLTMLGLTVFDLTVVTCLLMAGVFLLSVAGCDT